MLPIRQESLQTIDSIEKARQESWQMMKRFQDQVEIFDSLLFHLRNFSDAQKEENN